MSGMDTSGSQSIATQAEATGAKTEYIAPRTPAETRLAELWARVLRVERVGIRDNFFHLGGDSILAIQLISRVRDEFGVELSLVHLFDADSTIAKMTQLIAELAQGEGQPSPAPLIRRTERGGGVLSFAQERLWFLHQYEADNAEHNRPVAYRLSGPLDVAALKKALSEILRRHEVLRSTYYCANDRPQQFVAPEQPVALTLDDLRDLPGDERNTELQQRLVAEARRSFNLSLGPLVRAKLFLLAENDHVLLLSMHHVVFDGWSAGILRHELRTLYDAFAKGKPSPLPELSLQYADVAAWQRQSLQGDKLKDLLGYWEEKLAGAPRELQLPTVHRRPPVRTAEGAQEQFVISGALHTKLLNLNRQCGVTLFMILTAAFNVLLHRYSEQEDIVIGTPVAGRLRTEMDKLIGCFINMLILRTDLSGNPTFRELLGRVREMAIEAYQHQELPFEKLVEHLQPERESSRTPLFQVMLQLRNVPEAETSAAQLSIEDFEFDTGIARCDLELNIIPTPAGLDCKCCYSTALFEAATIRRLLQHFHTLLQGIVEGGLDLRLSELPLLSEDEQHQLLVEWNRTEAEFPRDKLIHQLIAEQAQRTPDSIALVFHEQRLSFQELNQRANRLAHYLRKHGVSADVPVAICMNRGVDMVVALLGVLKAGGAYAPLEPDHPQPRILWTLQDSGAKLLLTHERLLSKFEGAKSEILCLDRDATQFQGEPDTNPALTAQPENLAYIIYTSGSTGKPKGVLISHRNVINFLAFMMHAYQRGPELVILELPSFAWDASVDDLFAPLVTGGKLVMLSDDEVKDPDLILDAIEEHQVTALPSVVPSLLQALTAAAERRKRPLKSLRVLISAGDELHVADYRKAREVFGQEIKMANHYGPTECTCTQSYYPLRGIQTGDDIIPIGRPIWNHQIYVLDRYMNPVPIGVPGELYIGGVGLAREYLGRPELTAERFVRNPFSSDPKARLYRTGDRGRYREDGNLEFLGRTDNQVKVRGHRIELGEIESALSRYPGVDGAVVMALDDESGDKYLAAYVVPRAGADLAVNELRQFLREQLPEFMVPSFFVTLETLPLTHTGKLNRKLLPPPRQSRNDLADAYLAPRTPLEEVIAEVMCEALNLPQVGIQDDFFTLGGHSLLAVRVIWRLRDRLKMEVPLRSIFESPTVAALATDVLQHQAAKREESEVARLLSALEGIPEDEAQRRLVCGDATGEGN